MHPFIDLIQNRLEQLGLCPASGAPCSAELLLQSAVMLHERAGVRVAAMALSSALDCNDHEAIQEHAATLRSAMGWDPAIGGGFTGGDHPVHLDDSGRPVAAATVS